MAHPPRSGIERFSPVFLTLDHPSEPPRLRRLPCEEREALRAFFGLSADPFPGEDDPSCYLGSLRHEMCLEMLRRGVADGVAFGMLTARGGLGRRFVARKLKRTLSGDACRVLELQIEPGLSSKAFSKGLLHALGFGWIYREQAAAHHLMSLVNKTLRAAAEKREARTVLLLHGAHRLSAELWRVLKTIADAGNDGRPVVTTLLFGDDALRGTLQNRDLASIRQRTFVRERLHPLSASETGRYIQRRLEQVHCRGRLFGPETDEPIFSATAGVYRDVNTLAANALVRAFLRRKRVVDLDVLAEA